VVDLAAGPFSTTQPTVENIVFAAGDGNWHVQILSAAVSGAN
jgi:hypothetical protein